VAGDAYPRITTLPTRAELVRPSSPVRKLLVWVVGSGVIGGLLGIAIQTLAMTLGDTPFDWWFVQMSVLMAEGITVSALVGTRYAFPQFEGLHPLLRNGLILLTLMGGAIAATALSLFLRPGIVIVRTTEFLALVGANTMLAILIGSALIAWENLKGSLEKAYEELRVKEAFEREMSLAREVQQELLPERAPTLPGYEMAYLCRPAALVGGDTFDFLELPEGRLGVTVGDVVGKGVAAALLMASIQALVRAIAPREGDPAHLNEIVSQALGSPGRPGRLVTFAYVIVDPATGELRYSLAGHHPPVIAGSEGFRKLEAGGLPLGVNIGVPYLSGRDCLAPGETLVIFTDGLVEAPPEEGPEEEFGSERAHRIVQEHSGARAEETLNALLEAYDAFTGDTPAADDMTIVVLRRKVESGEEGGRDG
jgi:hypothetical protein